MNFILKSERSHGFYNVPTNESPLRLSQYGYFSVEQQKLFKKSVGFPRSYRYNDGPYGPSCTPSLIWFETNFKKVSKNSYTNGYVHIGGTFTKKIALTSVKRRVTLRTS